MKTGPKDYFKNGDWNAECDRCAGKFKASELHLEWQGYRVCDSCFELRHPQDLIKVRKEHQSVPVTRRPIDMDMSGVVFSSATVNVTFGPVDVAGLGYLPPPPEKYVFKDTGEPGDADRFEWHNDGDTSWIKE